MWGSQAVHFQQGCIHARECNSSAANRENIHLVVHLGQEVVGRASLAHELEGSQVKAGQNGVAFAARGCVGAMRCCGLASAHRCDCANCRSGAKLSVILPSACNKGRIHWMGPTGGIL